MASFFFFFCSCFCFCFFIFYQCLQFVIIILAKENIYLLLLYLIRWRLIQCEVSSTLQYGRLCFSGHFGFCMYCYQHTMQLKHIVIRFSSKNQIFAYKTGIPTLKKSFLIILVFKLWPKRWFFLTISGSFGGHFKRCPISRISRNLKIF